MAHCVTPHRQSPAAQGAPAGALCRAGAGRCLTQRLHARLRTLRRSRPRPMRRARSHNMSHLVTNSVCVARAVQCALHPDRAPHPRSLRRSVGRHCWVPARRGEVIPAILPTGDRPADATPGLPDQPSSRPCRPRRAAVPPCQERRRSAGTRYPACRPRRRCATLRRVRPPSAPRAARSVRRAPAGAEQRLRRAQPTVHASRCPRSARRVFTSRGVSYSRRSSVSRRTSGMQEVAGGCRRGAAPRRAGGRRGADPATRRLDEVTSHRRSPDLT